MSSTFRYAVVRVDTRDDNGSLHPTMHSAIRRMAEESLAAWVDSDTGRWRVIEIPPGESEDFDGVVVASLDTRRGQ